MTLGLITGINIGLALANVMIAFFSTRIFKAHQRYLDSQIDFYKRNTPEPPPPNLEVPTVDMVNARWGKRQ